MRLRITLRQKLLLFASVLAVGTFFSVVAMCANVISGFGRPQSDRAAATSPTFPSHRRAEAGNGLTSRVQAPAQPPQKPSFREDDLVRPIYEFREFQVADASTLPNCLEVFARCNAVDWGPLTTAQYKAAATAEARKFCRVVLKVIDVDATYDLVECELLTDSGASGVAELVRAGSLNGYTRHLKERFRLQDLKKKGLKPDRVSKGDVVVLVGLGDVVDASSWGAASPRMGLPKSDERYVMLRAFGKPHAVRTTEYAFSFMIRNWYIASR